MHITAGDLLVEEYAKVDCQDTVSCMLAEMVSNHQHFALVFDGKKYMGLAAKKWLLTSRIDADCMKISNLFNKRSKAKTAVFVPQLSLDTPVREICRLMATASVHALPVMGKNGGVEYVRGVVTAKDVVKALRTAYQGVPVMDLATVPVITFEENQPLGHALNIMSQKGIDRAPVVGKDGKLSGILSLVDIIERYHIWTHHDGQHIRGKKRGSGKMTGSGTGEKQDALTLPVSDFVDRMEPQGVVPAAAKMEKAMAEMEEHDVSSIVLVKDERPVGIITVKDIISDYSSDRSRKVRDV